MVNGDGSDLSNNESLRGRTRRKIISQSMMLKLIDVAKENGDSVSENAYWNTYYCQQKIITADGRLYGKYCKNRFCTLCCSIRKAEIINRYKPFISQWAEPCFVTITIRAVKEEKLKSRIDALIRGFTRINQKYRKRHQRGNPFKLVGIKSLEYNFNPAKKTYNPHLHIITETKEMAEVIVDEWLKLCTSKFAFRIAQKIIPVYDIEKTLIEIIKYGTKVFTEPDLKKRAKETDTVHVYIRAIDNIITAMRGKRIFDRFGFNLPNENKKERPKAKILSDFEEWEFNPITVDWENTTSSELLTGYKIPSHLLALLNNNLNTFLK